MNRRNFARIASASLLGSASVLSLTSAAQAHEVLFSSAAEIPKGPIETGRETVLGGGTVQIRLNSGAIASFVDAAQFSIRPDGGVDLRSGSVTIVGTDGETAIHMPEGVRGLVSSGSTGMFTANAKGSRGSTTAGSVAVTGNGATKTFTVGQFWTAGMGRAPDRVIAGVVAAVPGATSGPVRYLRDGGIVAAAENGIPIALGEALAAAGARGDIVAAARRVEAFTGNPGIATFPTGDYSLLVAYAAQAASPFGGGTAFNGASADIIRTYFQYLAAGNSGDSFRTAYAGILVNYLDLVRSGVLPSTFRGATQAQLDAYLAFIGRTEGFGALSPANKQLLDAYLAFLSAGGSADAFGSSVTNLTTAFLNFIRGGGQPAAFTQASASVVAQYLAIVQSGGLKTNLTAQNQALLAAYLNANGIGFVQTNATALAAFVAYLNTGGLPSGYTALPPATIRAYLETLETTGLFDAALGTQAAFLRTYLTFLRGGGTADQFNALPINVARVNAAALSLYVDYLLGGGIPSAYTALTQAQIRAYLDQLTAVGQFNALLGSNAAFLTEYYAYLRTGADADTFAGLPTVDVNAYADALTVFAAYLRAGNLPSGYATLTAQQIRSYLTALQVSGRLALLGGNAALLTDYLTYIRGGGAPDAFTGLPIATYQNYAAALSTYFAFLNSGGLPSNYTALTQAQIRLYLDTLGANGQLALLGANSAFYSDYLAYLAGGGAPDAFTGLPIVTFQSYAAALNAYFAFLNGGGLPSGYTALTQAQVRSYLDALKAAGQINALLGANAGFYTDYLAFLVGGGAPDAFTGLPVVTFRNYATALNAYYAFLLGGGSPSAYTALTQAQIRAYLDALSSANQLGNLLGANATFFSNYLAYLATGGNPNAYSGLPSSTYGQYAAALTAYFTYLERGGLPSGYTALTAAQIREYLDVLQANGQLTALLGTNATFFSNYLTFLAGGGAPDSFTGLPIVTFQGYATALNAYYAFLADGGLPASYTALTAAQIRNYLDALQAAGQVNALLGANASFFASYLTYLAGGGVPDRFQGLPAFVTYEAALRTYYAFLQGGGRPSAYTALTQAQIVAYIQALDAAGLIALKLTAAEAAFLRDYAAFVGGGANADQFAGLPGNTPSPTPVVTQGFAGVPLSSAMTAASGKGIFSPVSRGNVQVSGGNVTGLPSTVTYARISTATVEARNVDNAVAIARVANGDFRSDLTTVTLTGNQGAHLIWGVQATNLPTTGSAVFGMVTATSPTRDDGTTAPGTFTGNLGVDFANLRVGWDSVIGIGGTNYRFASAGGTAAPSVAIGALSTFNGTASTANNGLVGTGTGFLASTGGALAGFSYVATTPGANGDVHGVAVFGKGQAAVTLPTVTPPVVDLPTLPAPNYPYVAGLPTGRVNVRTISQANNFRETNIVPNVAVTLAANGGLDRIGTGTQVQDFQRGTAKVADIAGDASAVVGRWYDGSFTQGTTGKTLGANQSLHYLMLAPPTFTIPTGGRVDYTVLAATQPTFQSGVTAPGLFDARMAVLFGTAPRVAIEGTVQMPEPGGTVTYAFATAGGIAGAAALPTTSFSGYNFSVNAPVTGVGLACTTNCTFRLDGAFAGADASRAGGYYYLTDSRNGADSIIGSVAFKGVVTGGGAANIVPMPAQPTYRYAGGFGGSVRGNIRGESDVVPNTYGAGGGAVNLSSTVDALGGVDSFGGGAIGTYARGTAQQADIAGDGILLIGRWIGGTQTVGNVSRNFGANDAMHYALLAPATLTQPTTGTIRYSLIGATQPTMYGGGTTTAGGQVGAGVFDATLGITFGTAPRLGIEGAIYMPEVAGNAVKYTFATSGGAATPGYTIGNVGGFLGGAVDINTPLVGPGLACPAGATNCQINFTGQMGGPNASRVGLTYSTFSAGGAPIISGAAAFGAVGTENQASLVGQAVHVFANGTRVDRGNYLATYEGDALRSYLSTGGATVTAGMIQESGRLAQTVGWARWTGDAAGPVTNQGPNAGAHVLFGTSTPFNSMPASGTVQYTLAGSTKPTLSNGSAAPGTITGTLGVAFGAVTSRVGFDLTATVGDYGWRMQTNGGSANPGNGLTISTTDRSFVGSLTKGTTLTGTTSGSCVGACTADVYGNLYGTGASHVGLGFGISDGALRANGVAVFAQTPATPPPTSGGGFTGSVTGQTTYAHAGGSLVDQGVTTATYDNDVVKSYVSFLTGTARSTAVVQESGRLAATIGWARWTGDTAGPLTNQGANAGVHIMSGTPTTVASLPASGTVQYTMVGGTKPTLGTGAVAPGTLTGTLGVAFGALPRVGFDLTASVGSYGWRVQTTGGSANPSASSVTVGAQLTFSGTFNSNVGTVTPTTAASCVSGCNVTVGGQFYGAGASHIGVAFNVLDTGPGGVTQASGIGIFAKP